MKFRPAIDCLEGRSLTSGFLLTQSDPVSSPIFGGVGMVAPTSPLSSPTGPVSTDPISVAPVGDFNSTGGSPIVV